MVYDAYMLHQFVVVQMVPVFTFKGLPCPNLGTGGFYCHGPYEFVSITMMKKGVELLLRLVRNNVYAHEDIPF